MITDYCIYEESCTFASSSSDSLVLSESSFSPYLSFTETKFNSNVQMLLSQPCRLFKYAFETCPKLSVLNVCGKLYLCGELSVSNACVNCKIALKLQYAFNNAIDTLLQCYCSHNAIDTLTRR